MLTVKSKVSPRDRQQSSRRIRTLVPGVVEWISIQEFKKGPTVITLKFYFARADVALEEPKRVVARPAGMVRTLGDGMDIAKSYRIIDFGTA